MDDRPRLLVVDDTPANIELLESMLAPRGFDVVSATSGGEALGLINTDPPDLVVLDVVMPGLDGLEVCRRLRADLATRMLPIILVTATAGDEHVRALDAGADDFLAKPIDRAELLARVQSLLRIKRYHETIERQASELAEWNRVLEARVAEQVRELERVNELHRFLSPQVADLLVSADGQNLLEIHRRQIAVACFRLSGFESLAETAAPEVLMDVLTEYHDVLGQVFAQYEQLSWLSSIGGDWGGPRSLMSSHGVQDGEELVHARC